MSEYAKAWRFKHPSPWDYAFFMSNALQHRDLGWFWNYWLFTTESVDGSISRRDDVRRQDDGHGAAGRPDAVAGRAEGAVRGRRAGRSSRCPTAR